MYNKILFPAIILLLIASCKPTNVLLTQNPSSDTNFPVINANSALVDYRVGEDWTKGGWTISPEIEFDSLMVICHSNKEVFAFYTDIDSIVFNISPNEVKDFYVALKANKLAHTVIKGIKPNYKTLKFDTISRNENLKFWYEQNKDNKYLDSLRTKFNIDNLVKDSKNDTEKALKILHWVHNQWQHNGNNVPQKNDAISILEEVKDGKNFRCVEYGIVATSCLNSIGLQSRVIGLKTKDVETTQFGAGHVLLEVFLNDLNKWVLMDGQWDIMPFLNGVPLNAVEFQKAIAENFEQLKIITESGVSKNRYIDWIYPYLYYFDFSFDNREGLDTSHQKIDGKTNLMLVPIGEKEPTIFQVNYKIDYCKYTHSLKDFYASPINK